MNFKLSLALFLTVLSISSARADDWPQWMGPRRDNIWREEGIIAKFPEGGPKVVWRAPVAGGYAGPAVANGKVYVTDYDAEGAVKQANFQRSEFTGNERVLCLDEATGKVLWKHEYSVKYDISYPAGPRCTPTVHGGKVYTLGSEGHLFCLDADTGKVLWSKDFNAEYGAKTAIWGYTGHPLVDGKTPFAADDANQPVAEKSGGRSPLRSRATRRLGFWKLPAGGSSCCCGPTPSRRSIRKRARNTGRCRMNRTATWS